MKFLDNTKISIKIVSLLLVLGALTIFIAWKGSSSIKDVNHTYSELVTIDLPNTTRVARANARVTSTMYAAYRTLANPANSPQAREASEAVDEKYRSAVEALEEVKRTEPAFVPQVDAMLRDATAIHAIARKGADLGMADRNEEAARMLAQADPLAIKFSENSKTVTTARIADSAAAAEQLTDAAGSAAFTMLLIGLIGVALGVGVALWLTRVGITGPLVRLQNRMREIAAGDYAADVDGTDRGDEIGAMAKAVLVFRENGIAKEAADKAKAVADAEQKRVVETVAEHLSDLSEGDLTSTIVSEFPGEYASLKRNFNDALDKLRDLIGTVADSAATIRTGSDEIAQASEDLARRTESNAASLEETAASVTQMDGRLRASAGAAARTVERADQAIATVGGGRAVADQAVQAMGRVSDSAKGIDSVIEGLDKIAFQTRVLAMNAAVEAGRAGDAGRGFAVVADLVSALAMRAEEEAKRARDQLTVTQTDIVTAVEAVTKVDGALADISGDVGQVHELLATMAADNQAQSAAITQISAAIGSMDQSTQQNAAMVEQTSAAARNLAGEVTGLADQAARFNTGHKNGSTPARSKVSAKSYASPVKPLPAAAIPALVRSGGDDWNAF